MGCTSYGLKYKVCSPEEWKQLRGALDSYDASVGDMHIANYGFVILDDKYNQPIDNEYDLEEIANQLKENAKKRIVRITESQLRTIIQESINQNYREAAWNRVMTTAENLFGDDEDSIGAAHNALQDFSPEEIMKMSDEELINTIQVGAM